MKSKRIVLVSAFWLALTAGPALLSQDLLEGLGRPQDFLSRRVSSYDRTGGNRDALPIEPGATAVLAEIAGPAAIHHIWVTIAAEPFYGRTLVLRLYWDGETTPSVETPVGDFFGVGHGLNRSFSSLPINCSSEGRARNCYWFMPFRKSARITVTNEGSRAVGAFYYYVDYRILKDLAADTPTFHAQYRQEMPCAPDQNYVLLEAEGRGHYVGCNLSILQKAGGWWGEGDDMIYVDGEGTPSLHGTGSEDYFSDAWGMREAESLFYGCPLQEEDYQAGSKATVYRFHIPDPVPFQKSIRATIEHGHGNDRSDYFSSVAYWYQTEPHKPFPVFPAVGQRLPYALEPPENFILPRWTETKSGPGSVFEDKEKALKLESERLSSFLTPFYGPDGSRYPAFTTERAEPDAPGHGTETRLTFPVEIKDRYNVHFYFLQGPRMGIVSAFAAGTQAAPLCDSLDGFSPEMRIARISLEDIVLEEGPSSIIFRVTGRNEKAQSAEMALVGMSLVPAARRFMTRWNLIGPFDAPDMTYLPTVYPPEKDADLSRKYPGKSGREAGWKTVDAEPSGEMGLTEIFSPNEQAIVYGLAYVHSPESVSTHLLLGSDDGVRVWINDELVHSNPTYRGADPDQDKVKVSLRKGWNRVLVKVLQGGGGWGFYLRFADPGGSLRYATKPE